MKITRLVMTETGTYNDMVSRPYEAHLDGDTLSAFQEATQWGENVTPSAIAGVAGNIVRPRAQPERQVGIVNGWETPRLRFMMEVEYEAGMGTYVTQVVCGYTDYVGATRSGNIDHNMKLYFNSSIILRHTQAMTSTGRSTISQMADNSHIVTQANQTPIGPSAFGGNSLTMRPEDLFNRMQTGGIPSELTAIDTRQKFIQGIKKSSRKNNLAPSYMSRVLDAHRHSMNDSDYGETYEDMCHKASGTVREGLIHSDGFMRNLTVASNLMEEGFIYFGDLMELDNTIADRAVLSFNTPTTQVSNHSRGDSANWSSTELETVAATALSNSVPSLMMDTMLTKVSFMVTNETFDGTFDCRILNAMHFNKNVSVKEYAERFMHRLQVEVLRDLSRNNNFTVKLEMHCDVIGETHINISMNGGPEIPYVTPSFSDGLLVPVLTTQQETLDGVTTGFEMLSDSSYGNQEMGPESNGPGGFGGPPSSSNSII